MAIPSPRSRKRILFHEIQHVIDPRAGLVGAVASIRIGRPIVAPSAGGKLLVHIDVAEAGQADFLRLLLHCVRRAASRADWMAGSKSATRMPMIAMTTSSSTSVNAADAHRAFRQ